MPPIKISNIGGEVIIQKIIRNQHQCYRCSTNIDENNDEYQLIFDDIGKDMNIKNLLNECFQIDVEEDNEIFQALCDDCLNELIETFDILELQRTNNNKLDLNNLKNSIASDANINTTVLSSDIIISSNEIGNDDYTKSNDEQNDYIFDESCYMMKTELNLQNDLDEVLSDDQDMKNVDYIIEDGEDICDDDEILAEYTVENEEDNTHKEENIEEENVEEDSQISNNMTQIEEIQNDQQLQQISKEELLIDYNEENCDDPDEIFINNNNNNRDEYEEIDYLDDVDDLTKLKEYLNKTICSNFKDITFPDSINCRLCNESLEKHSTVLDHCKMKHNNEDNTNYICVIDENCDHFNSLEDLSNHLVFKHYDLNTLNVYSQCSFCTKRFNNIIMFNKHSCYDNKNTSRSTTECNLCKKIYQSNKRYRFHLQFHLEKHRPKACLICRKFFDDDNELFEHVMYEREPKDALICKLCDRNFLQIDTFINHKNVHHLKRPYACTYCDKTYLSGQQLQDHVNAQHLQKDIYKCAICNKEFFKRNILQKHLLNHKEPVEVILFFCNECGFLGKNHEAVKTHIGKTHKSNLVNILANMHTIAYCCEYCEMAFNSYDNLIIHRKIHNDKLYKCQLCSSSFDTFKKVRTHRQTHQKYVDIKKLFPIDRHYVCDVEGCTSSYVQWVALMSHKRNIHLIGKQKPYKCEQCNEACANKRNLNLHIQQKHGEKPIFPCPFCPKIYLTPMAIAVHIARMHNNNKLACEHCGTLCKNKDALEKHIINTHEVLTCHICEKVLKNMKNLRTHIKMVHKKEKRYFCQYCKRGYYNNCDRLTHEQAIHLKNKVYTCDICTYTTPYRESILIHQKNHTNTKPYECTVCQKKFARKYSLTLHLRRHAEVRKFICPYKECDSSYPNQGILNLHMRNKHADETTLVSKHKSVSVEKTKLAKMLKKGIPADYLIEDDENIDENDLNFIDEITSGDSEEMYVCVDGDGRDDSDGNNGNNENKNCDDYNQLDIDENIEYVINDDNIIDDNEQKSSNEYIDDIADVEIDPIILDENNDDDDNNYILRENDEIEEYEIIGN